MTARSMTPLESHNVQVDALARMQIVVWTIYKHPPHRPNDFVLQPSIYGEDLPLFAVGPYLASLHAYLPSDLERWERFEDDDAAVVERWM